MIRKLFLDMDGVITDFDTAACRRLNLDKSKLPEKQTWTSILDLWDGTEEEFWESLDERFWLFDVGFTPEAQEILELVEPYKPVLLTAPPKTGGATGKMLWIRNNLRDYWCDDRWFIGTGTEYLADQWHVLIDDAPHNINAWERNGGYGILVPRPWNNLRGEDVVGHIKTMIDWIEDYSHFAQGGTA